MVYAAGEIHSEWRDELRGYLEEVNVEAEIIGHLVNGVVVLPRSAIQVNDQVYVVGNDNRLQFRDVDILRNVGEEVYVTDGVRAGENLCLSALTYAVPGMLVMPVVGTGEMAAL